MTLTIRPYRPQDRSAAALIFFRAVNEGAAEFYDAAERAAWAPSREPDPETPDKLLKQWCWIAECNGQAVGFMSLDRTGYLDMAFVLPEEMGKGTAHALYDAVRAQARDARMTRLTVIASQLARRFLLKRGWQISFMENLACDGQVLVVFRMFHDLPQGAG